MSYIQNLLKRFYKKPSDSLAQRIEAITGIEADYSDHDQDFFEPRNKQE